MPEANGRTFLVGLLLGPILLVAVLILVPRAGAAMYWGGTIKGAVFGIPGEVPTSQAVLDRFEKDVGKKLTFVNTGQGWASFDQHTMQAAIDIGAIPLVTMGLPNNVTLAEVAAGEQDPEIRAWAREAKAFGYPFLFRPWWEVNGDWYSWGRKPEYISAWRHFHDLVEDEGATNVTWAWVVNTVWSDPASDPVPYYPGDAYVDWVGMDAYNWGLSPIQHDRWMTPEEAIGPTLEVLRRIAPNKPVCICEGASTEFGGDKAAWITDLLDNYLPSQPDIKAYLWFNWNVEQNEERWDWPIESSAAAQKAFRAGIQNDTYLSSLPALTKLTKVPLPTAPAVTPVPAPVDPSTASDPATDMGTVGGLELGRPRFNRRAQTVTQPVAIPGPGTLEAVGKGALASIPGLSDALPAHIVRVNGRAGTVMLRLRASPSTRRRLESRDRVSVAVVVRFTSVTGATSRRAATYVLRGSPRTRRPPHPGPSPHPASERQRRAI